ncbi:hypothetical protein GCM10010206_05870 [Streptomyces cinerochromogenes]|nr:hypothetical protein GCM10010206_05870 [Streptomyces cinerochromogenes]
MTVGFSGGDSVEAKGGKRAQITARVNGAGKTSPARGGTSPVLAQVRGAWSVNGPAGPRTSRRVGRDADASSGRENRGA